MENEKEVSSLRLNIPKQIHRAIKSHCAKTGENIPAWYLAAIVAAYENEINAPTHATDRIGNYAEVKVAWNERPHSNNGVFGGDNGNN